MKWLLCFYCCFMWVALVVIFGYLCDWNKKLNEKVKKYRNKGDK